MAEPCATLLVPAALRAARYWLGRGGGNRYSPASQRCHHTARRVSSAATAFQPKTEFPYAPATTVPNTAIQREGRLRSREAIRNAKPFSEFLTDNFQRQHDYLRISITERCNLRCLYCMPEEGVPLSPPAHLLTSPEIFYISSLFVSQGVRKIRLTGGEPTVRRDIVPLMQSIGTLRSKGLRELCLTTNGISLHRKLDSMVEAGLTGINLSLDTLDPFQFQIMTRRNGFDAVMKCINRVLEMNQVGAGIKLKVNCVVMRGLNEREIVPFVEMGREKDIEVRFIEYMPFGGNKWSQGKMVSYQEMLKIIREKYPGLHKVQGHKNDTSKTYQVPGFVGKVGFITSMTNDFCSTCNRLRITSDGNLKVCLHGNAEVSLRDILRKGNNGNPIDEKAFEALKQLETNRWNGLLSDETPLGWGEREKELLEVIGAAVKRKKEKHADISELKNMENRPMILIGKARRHFSQLPHLFFPKLIINGFISSFLLHSKTYNGVLSASRFFSTATRQFQPKSPVSSSSLTEQENKRGKANQTTTSNTTLNALPHLTHTGAAHMVSVTAKAHTARTAIATGRVLFSNDQPLQLIKTNSLKKGDVLSVARIAGIMAAKKTPDIIPLCHPIGLTGVSVELYLENLPADTSSSPSASTTTVTTNSDPVRVGAYGAIVVEAKVTCVGQTGVEMEALMAVLGAAATVYDMCKAVDKGMVIQDVCVVLKEGGKSGTWKEEKWVSAKDKKEK